MCSPLPLPSSTACTPPLAKSEACPSTPRPRRDGQLQSLPAQAFNHGLAHCAAPGCEFSHPRAATLNFPFRPSQVRDPLLSPVFAPDETLKQLPPVTLLCGGLDPLLDDSVDFNTRIRRMGVPGELHIYRSLPHTFVSFPHWHILPEVEAALATTVRHIRSVCMRGQPPLDDSSSRSDESVASDSEDNGFAHLGSTDHQTDSDPLEGLN